MAPGADSINSVATGRNIDAIAQLEQDALQRRSVAERTSSVIAKFIGNLKFAIFQAVLVFGWIAFNLHPPAGMHSFDPFPFGMLAMLVSAEGVFFTVFVLVSQNAIIRQADRRSHLDLQISMLTEQELTTALNLLQKLCRHAGVDVSQSDKVVADFSKATDVHRLASELDDKLPDQ